MNLINNNGTSYQNHESISVDFNADLKKLEKTFKTVQQKYQSGWQQRAVLAWIAKSHGLPRAEIRKLFELWAAQTKTVGGSDNA